MQWWEQAGLDLAGALEVAAVAEEFDEGEELKRGIKGGLSGRNNCSEYKVAIYN